MEKKTGFLQRFGAAWRVLTGQESKITALSVAHGPSASQEIIIQTPVPAVIEEETELHFRLRRFSRYEGMRFEDIENGKATLLEARIIDYKETIVGSDFIRPFKEEVETDRAFFQQLKDNGTYIVPIAGDLRFKMSIYFIDFYPEPPADRPSVVAGVDGQKMHMAVKPEVEIDVLIKRCDEVIEECDKALRAGMALPGKGTVPLPAPTT